MEKHDRNEPFNVYVYVANHEPATDTEEEDLEEEEAPKKKRKAIKKEPVIKKELVIKRRPIKKGSKAHALMSESSKARENVSQQIRPTYQALVKVASQQSSPQALTETESQQLSPLILSGALLETDSQLQQQHLYQDLIENL
jgi:hypothetical protein